jgi:hypothetical protein
MGFLVVFIKVFVIYIFITSSNLQQQHVHATTKNQILNMNQIFENIYIHKLHKYNASLKCKSFPFKFFL